MVMFGSCCQRLAKANFDFFFFVLFLLIRCFTCAEESEPEESEEPFVAPPGLSIPPDVELVSFRFSAVFLETL